MASFDRTIPPGGRGKIVLAVNTSGYKGQIRESALVQTNDPKNSKRLIEIILLVTPTFSTQPVDRLIIQTAVGKPADISAELTSNLPTPVEVKGVGHSFGDEAEVKLETIEPGRKYRVTLTAHAKKKFRLSGWVTLDLKGASSRPFALQAFIEVKE
ncbi:MAG: hypothetical protein V1742_05770 [Pseudomonadota bacterium]